jgi:hypothetical protein
MKISKLDKPHIKLMIAHGIANGHSQRHIAQTLETSQPAISRMARHEDVLTLIRKEENRLCKQIRKAFRNMENDPQLMAVLQTELTKKLFSTVRRIYYRAVRIKMNEI